MNSLSSLLCTVVVFAMFGINPGHLAAAPLLVDDGTPRAQIVIAEDPPRMTALAAEELQSHIAQISGAILPIATTPSSDYPLRIYVGHSPYTSKYAIDDDLPFGAFIMRTVPDGLLLVGQDDDFVPTEPFTLQRSPNHPDVAQMWAEWDAVTGDTFGNPRGMLGRRYNSAMGIYTFDQRGSLNAVHEFLRDLGVRWYMPGELGTIIPTQRSIALPQIDEKVTPAFDWRMATFATYFSSPSDEILYYLRQGFNHGDVVGHWSHGLRDVTSRSEMKEKHPERYALVRGVRQSSSALGHGNQACLSDPGLIDAAVRFGRIMYDHYDLPMVSVMPQDGFMFCECELCEGKDTPERGRDGLHSDYVWGFVDQVARELYKTHPDRMVNCLAYGTYRLPPAKIDRLSPNVSVGIVHSRGREFDRPEVRDSLLELRRQWREKTDTPFWTWEHYLFSDRAPFIPFYFPQAIAEGIRASHDDHFGEFIEVTTGPFQERGHGLHSPGITHLNVYVTGRMQWDPNLDLDELLAEYYQLFYGPAASPMQAFIEYCEANRNELRQEVDRINTALALLDAAVAAAPEGSPYAERIALVVDYMQGLTEWRDQLERGRENVPLTHAPTRRGAPLTVDGRLDEAVWQDLPEHPLVDVRSGEPARTPSWFKIYWDGDDREGHLVVGIYCAEPDMENLRTTTSESGDWRLFNDDNVEVLIETQAHSYYQIAANAAGAVTDMARTLGHRNLDWTALAEAAAHQGEDYWSVELRIPVTGESTASDPNHEVVGWRPSADAPWHIQVGRQRLRGEDREWTTWSPTGSTFHDIMRFGRLE